MYGKHHTEETKRKISLARRNQKKNIISQKKQNHVKVIDA